MKKYISLTIILLFSSTFIFGNYAFCQYSSEFELSEEDKYEMLDDYGKGKFDGQKLASERCSKWPWFWIGFFTPYIFTGIALNTDMEANFFPAVELGLILTVGLPVPRADVPPKYLIDKSEQYQLGLKLGYQRGKRGKRLEGAYKGVFTSLGLLVGIALIIGVSH